jgi:adenine-specific DNA-methyltransferase
MNSLLEKEGMAGQVQMVYMDPPYGGSVPEPVEK